MIGGHRRRHAARHPFGAVSRLAWEAKELLAAMMTHGTRLRPGDPLRSAAGIWRVNPARSYVSFAARVAGRAVGSLTRSGVFGFVRALATGAEGLVNLREGIPLHP